MIIRIQLMLAVLLAITIPVLFTGYYLIHQLEESLLQEKEARLISIARGLDNMFIGTWNDLLGEGQLTREQKLAVLNEKLQLISDRVAADNPGVGVGYYSKELDAVVTYGPSHELKHKIGVSIGADHPGRLVLEDGQPRVYTGEQVRGYIMNAMVPLQREGEIIGYVWANELMSDIQMQLADMERKILSILAIGGLISILCSLYAANRIGGKIDRIIGAIQKIGDGGDLSKRVPEEEGELGRIPQAVNELLHRIARIKGHTDAIVSSVSDGIITLDREGKVTEWNEAAAQITGYSIEEMMGKRYELIFPPGVQAAQQSALLRTLQTGEAYASIDLEFPSRNGELIPINSSTAFLRDAKGQAMGVVVVFRDLRDRKKMEERMRRADQMRALGELAAGMAHEIRNPLTSIKAFSQIVEEGLQDPDPEANREYLSIIAKEVDRINRLVEQLLLFGKPSIQQESPVRLIEVFERSWLLIEHDARKKRLAVQREWEAVVMQADFHLLQQVVINLLMNAVQAAEPGGDLILRIFQVNEVRGFSVFNTGGPVRDDCFQPFATSRSEGTGLGLSVTQHIVSLYGGRIFFDNQEKGVLFQVEFPMRTEERV
ncbi:PAS domain S-box protein [Ammoniphilus sp. YIM 78166]|uniref:PAS domain S-box protein n=1 Tax=Ammoniphilus sp. YIM 78166 TaxID=1644106 RepID=UPI0010705BC8|nr:PAS domain S-box protein [Ammoniphilus sp. YIM 78166]